MDKDDIAETERRMRCAFLWIAAQGSGGPRGHVSKAWPEDLMRAGAALKLGILEGKVDLRKIFREGDLDDFDFETPDEPTRGGFKRLAKFGSDEEHLAALNWFARLNTGSRRHPKAKNGIMNRDQRVVLARLSVPQPSWPWVARTFGTEHKKAPHTDTVKGWYRLAIEDCTTWRLREEASKAA